MDIEEAIRLYNSVGPRNGNFLFKWLYKIYSKVYLPCIDPQFKENLAKNKTKLTIFDVLVDDLADNYKLRNGNLLEQFIQIPWNNTKEYKNEYLEAGRKIWQSCISSIKKYPRFKEFERMFYFDLRQVLYSMEYSFLVNTMYLDNQLENKIYLPHGCMVILHCDMDLMCSPAFDINELNKMRIIFHLAQRICHIGNMLNTYPKEIKEKDFSSPIISLAIEKGLVKRNELIELSKLKNLEYEFKKEVNECLKKLKEYEIKIKSVNLYGFSNNLKKLFIEFINRKRYWED
jgi:hypothetical protein